MLSCLCRLTFCQLDLAQGIQMFGQTRFWVLLNEINIEINTLSKADCPP